MSRRARSSQHLPRGTTGPEAGTIAEGVGGDGVTVSTSLSQGTPARTVVEVPHARFGAQSFEVYPYSEILNFLARNASYDAPHYIDFYSILLVVSGSGEHLIDYAPVPFQAGDLLCISPHQVHRFDTNRAIQGYSLAFTQDFLCATPADTEAFAGFFIFRAPPLERRVSLAEPERSEFVRAMALLEREYLSPPNFARKELMRACIKVLLISAERIKRRQATNLSGGDPCAEWVRFQRLLERDCTRHRDVRYYARALGTSTKQLGRVVQRVTGGTVKAAINERIVLEGKRWLANTSLSVKEIASCVGFSDATTFVKFFKHGCGETPSEFRARSRLTP